MKVMMTLVVMGDEGGEMDEGGDGSEGGEDHSDP